MALSGNKGEWSELYVLIKLLADGLLFQSDMDLNRDEENVYKIIEGFKEENQYTLKFCRNEEISLYRVSLEHETLVNKFCIDELVEIYKKLYNGIVGAKRSPFKIDEVEDFLKSALIERLKANPDSKADIKLKIYDHRLAKETDLGFSIKSLLGGDSTLFNTGPGNNFIYVIRNVNSLDISEFNKTTIKPDDRTSKITYRLKKIIDFGGTVDFEKVQSKQLWKNLKMIDGDLPDILGFALYYRWLERKSSLLEVVDILEKEDPLNYYDGEIDCQRLYEYKLKRFLTEVAMGMTSEKAWLGEYDSFGGVIIAKNDGDIVCFHIYDFNLFRNYLITNTVFEQASTGEDKDNPGNARVDKRTKKYYYGWLYEEDDCLMFKINLQIRFR